MLTGALVPRWGTVAGVPGPRRSADDRDAGWFAPVATRRRPFYRDVFSRPVDVVCTQRRGRFSPWCGLNGVNCAGIASREACGGLKARHEFAPGLSRLTWLAFADFAAGFR